MGYAKHESFVSIVSIRWLTVTSAQFYINKRHDIKLVSNDFWEWTSEQHQILIYTSIKTLIRTTKKVKTV